MKKISILALLWVIVMACTQQDTSQQSEKQPSLFTLLPAEKTGVDFQNIINEGPNTNVLMYEYFYNGGGVAVGDLNGDQLDDLYFTANMSANKLYLNRTQPTAKGGTGEIKFEDITVASGAAGREGPWRTGVTMADVNGDGRLDIFVCHSGNLPPEKKHNELFINQGNTPQGIPTFKEQAAEYGLAMPTSSTNAYFFDFDRDGDLDLFLLNHNIKSLPVLNESNSAEFIKMDDAVSGCRFFENTSNGRQGGFRDITTRSGINSSPLSYGLGAGIADINQDGWPDIYVSNDYTIPDRLYINQRNGTFKDKLGESLPYTSQFSMGNDVADVNNDAAPDIFTLDMLPEDNRRQKLLMAPDNYDKFDMTVRSGFHKQFMRNMLHLSPQTPDGGLNQKASIGGLRGFSEIGQLAGVSNTDWSWAALFADYDNDGWKDLYITNGYLRDYTNLDFLKYMNDFQQNAHNVTREDVLNLVLQMPASNVNNYAFRNNQDLTFSHVGADWGLSHTSNSNGAAFADLDNDGDLEMIVNNINAPAFIYQNEANKTRSHHYLKISLKGLNANTYGIGAKLKVFIKNQVQYLEQMPTRGYQSSVSPTLHFGLGTATLIDSLQILWSHGKQQTLRQVKADTWLTLNAQDATETPKQPAPVSLVFDESQWLTQTPKSAAAGFNDFKRQTLMVNPQSQVGPCLAQGDINGDGLEDVFVGGRQGSAGQVFLQQKDGNFRQKPQPALAADTQSDATDAVFFDADGDKDLDLYVCYGGYGNFEPQDARLQDALYRNDGQGNLTKAPDALPAMRVSTSCARVGDLNGDGRADLFVGGRVVPGEYPTAPKSFLLLNTGGKFTAQPVVDNQSNIGMVTDAAWLDLNGDRRQDLIVVGEWMAVTVFENQNGKLQDKTDQYFDKRYSGWWNKLLVEDFDGDGKMDLLVGNHGLNSQIKATDQQPAELYYKDFDQNGKIDPILCSYIQGKSYPYITRDELISQLPIMGKRFSDYKTYADATLNDIFDSSELNGAGHLTANQLSTTLFLRNNTGKFVPQKLPIQVQTAPVYALQSLDFDRDGRKDILLAGNQLHTRLRLGHNASNHGILLRNIGKGEFSYVPQAQSGFYLSGEVRSLLWAGNKLFMGLYNEGVKMYEAHTTAKRSTPL